MKAVRDFLELIKFEHTIFALPFAYLGMLLAAGGFPSWDLFLWITVAMAAARTVAMGFNRIADRWHDAHNPRTANRPLVTGSISLRTAWTGTLIASLILAYAAWRLGPLTFRLLPGAFLFSLVTLSPNDLPGFPTSSWDSQMGWRRSGLGLQSAARFSPRKIYPPGSCWRL
jgi:4-hydroxybenzoate polyprenyltransferase